MKGKIARILGALLVAAGVVIATQGTSASAATAKGEAQYQAWLDQTAVIASVDGVVTRYTERQVGSPAFQAQKHQQFVGGVSAQTLWWNCSAGVGCGWIHTNGGGDKVTLPISLIGTDSCYPLSFNFDNTISSASADYGSGLDLKLWGSGICLGTSWAVITSSHSANFTGALSWFNDTASGAMAGQYG